MSFNQKIRKILNDKSNVTKNLCCNKLYLKEYVYQKTRECLFPKTLCTATCVDELISKISSDATHPSVFWVKSNNDSGGTQKVNGSLNILHSHKERIERYRHKSYGQNNNEWFYNNIPYTVYSEECIGENVTDYKFHCSAGTPRFCQVIRNREIKPTNEVLLEWDDACVPSVLPFQLDTNFLWEKQFDCPANFAKMIEIAQVLCKDFDYVRVDMYSVDEKIYVGELTFAPMGGRYHGQGEVLCGNLLKEI